MKKLLIGLIGLVALAALGVSAVFAAPSGTISFNPEPVNVGDTYTVSAGGLRPGEVIHINGQYAAGAFGCEGYAAADGTFSCELTAIDLGLDTDGGRFRMGDGPWFVAEPGEVIHIVWQLKKQGCGGHNGCYDMMAYDTLTVEP